MRGLAFGMVVLVGVGLLVGCAGQGQTPEQKAAQRKYGSAAQEPTQLPPPSVPVNPPPTLVNPPSPPPPPPRADAGSVGAVQALKEPPPVAAPDTGAPVGEGYRPSWWIAGPQTGNGKVTVAAKADGLTLIEARQRVVGAGLQALRAEVGDPKNAQTLKTGVAKLEGGGYRAFVLMAGERK